MEVILLFRFPSEAAMTMARIAVITMAKIAMTMSSVTRRVQSVTTRE